MKAATIMAGIAAVFVVSAPAFAGYGQLMTDFNNYQPPDLIRNMDRGPIEKPDKDQQRTLIDQAVTKLDSARIEALQSLRNPSPGELFYRPNATRMRALAPAVDNISLAQDALAYGFALEDLETLVLLRSPAVRAAGNRVEAAIEGYSQVANLDQILATYAALTETVKTKVGPMMNQGGSAKQFPFPGVIALKGAIVDQDVKIAREKLEAIKRDQLTMARKYYWNLLYNRRAQSVTWELIRRLEQFEAVLAVAKESGRANLQDLIKVKVLKELQQEGLETLRQERRNLETAVLELLALPPDSKVGRPAVRTPSPELPELVKLNPLALRKRQELKATKAAIEKMTLMIELAETRILPKYTLDLSLYADQAANQVGSQAKTPTFATTTKASMGAGLPKAPWYGTGDAFLRETRERLKALESDLVKKESGVLVDVRKAWFNLDKALREEKLYRESLIQLSAGALDASLTGFETGRVVFADVIDSYNLWLKTGLSGERRRADLGVAQAELSAAVGLDSEAGTK